MYTKCLGMSITWISSLGFGSILKRSHQRMKIPYLGKGCWDGVGHCRSSERSAQKCVRNSAQRLNEQQLPPLASLSPPAPLATITTAAVVTHRRQMQMHWPAFYLEKRHLDPGAEPLAKFNTRSALYLVRGVLSAQGHVKSPLAFSRVCLWLIY